MVNRFASALTLAGIAAGVWFVPATTQAATPTLSDASPLTAPALDRHLDTPDLATSGNLLAQYATPSTTVVSNQRSLTVTGTGQSNLPADQAILQLFYYSTAPVDAIDVSAVPPPINVNELQFVVNALTQLGVSASDITVYADPSSYGGARVQLKLAQPTTDRISQILEQTNQVIAEDGRFTPSSTNVIYTIEQCAVPENAARRAAMADVQTRAADLATIAGVELGEILTLSDYSTWNLSYSATCPSTENLGATPLQYGGYPFDPTLPPTVGVTSQVTATFAIE